MSKNKTNKNQKSTAAKDVQNQVANVVEKTLGKTETKKPAAKVVPTLNAECEKVLKVIVKFPGLRASEIKKKLKWAFVPSRALSRLCDDGFAGMKDFVYTAEPMGTKALNK
jgi:hypothetical protein